MFHRSNFLLARRFPWVHRSLLGLYCYRASFPIPSLAIIAQRGSVVKSMSSNETSFNKSIIVLSNWVVQLFKFYEN